MTAVEIPGKLYLHIIYDRPDGISFAEQFGPYPSRPAAQAAANFINNQDRKAAGLLPAFASVRFQAFAP